MRQERILVVFSLLPETIHFIEFHNANLETARLLESWNGKYIGAAMTDEETSQQMNDFFYNQDGTLKHQDNIATPPLKDRSYDLIVECGFLL